MNALQDVVRAILHAPPGLGGPALAVAVFAARWLILVGPATLACLWLLGGRVDRSAAIAAAAAGALGLAIAAVLSPLIAEQRPFLDGTTFNYLDHAADGSFPSDHATLAFALAFGLWRHRPPLLPRVWAPLVAAAVAIGWARVFLGTHHAVDILGGAVVAIASVQATATRLGRSLLSRATLLDETLRSGALARIQGTRRAR